LWYKIRVLSASGHTAYNKRFGEMAVGVETGSLVLPLTAYGILRRGAPHPPLRQAAWRYAQAALID